MVLRLVERGPRRIGDVGPALGELRGAKHGADRIFPGLRSGSSASSRLSRARASATISSASFIGSSLSTNARASRQLKRRQTKGRSS